MGQKELDMTEHTSTHFHVWYYNSFPMLTHTRNYKYFMYMILFFQELQRREVNRASAHQFDF